MVGAGIPPLERTGQVSLGAGELPHFGGLLGHLPIPPGPWPLPLKPVLLASGPRRGRARSRAQLRACRLPDLAPCHSPTWGLCELAGTPRLRPFSERILSHSAQTGAGGGLNPARQPPQECCCGEGATGRGRGGGDQPSPGNTTHRGAHRQPSAAHSAKWVLPTGCPCACRSVSLDTEASGGQRSSGRPPLGPVAPTCPQGSRSHLSDSLPFLPASKACPDQELPCPTWHDHTVRSNLCTGCRRSPEGRPAHTALTRAGLIPWG